MSKFIDINGLRHYNEKITEKITTVQAKIPTANSQLTNDSLYITNQVNDLVNYYSKNNTYTKTEVDTKIASLIDSAPETLNTLNELAVAVQDNNSLIDTLNSAIGTKANQSALESLQTEVNNITVPTKLSDLTDDKGYLTSYTETDPTVPSHVKSITENDITKWNNKVESSALSSYSLTTHNHDAVYSKLDHTHTYSELTGKPTLSTVATSGSYNDLTNKPTLPTKLSDLTNDLNLSSKLEFSTYKNGTDNHYLGVGIAPSDPGAAIMYAVDNGRTYTDGNSLLDALDSETSILSGIMLTPAGVPIIVSKSPDGLGSWWFGTDDILLNGTSFTDKFVAKSDLTGKYIHELYISAGGAGGSFEIYTRLYTDTATPISINNLVNTYTLTNKMANINGYLANASGNNVVYNVFFESTTAAHFNGASLSCTGSTITVQDTVVGRLV